MRKCKKCSRKQELNEDNFRISKGYFVHTCRACSNARDVETRVERKTGRRKLTMQLRPSVERLQARYLRDSAVLKKQGIDISKAIASKVDRVLAGMETGKK